MPAQGVPRAILAGDRRRAGTQKLVRGARRDRCCRLGCKLDELCGRCTGRGCRRLRAKRGHARAARTGKPSIPRIRLERCFRQRSGPRSAASGQRPARRSALALMTRCSISSAARPCRNWAAARTPSPTTTGRSVCTRATWRPISAAARRGPISDVTKKRCRTTSGSSARTRTRRVRPGISEPEGRQPLSEAQTDRSPWTAPASLRSGGDCFPPDWVIPLLRIE